MNKKATKIKRCNDIVSSTLFSVLSFVIFKLFLSHTITEETGLFLLSALGILYFVASKTVLKKVDEVASAKYYHFIDIVNSDTSEVATLISGIVMIPAFVAAFNYGPSVKTLAFWCVFGGISLTINYLMKTKLSSLESLLAKKLKMVEDRIVSRMEATFWN